MTTRDGNWKYCWTCINAVSSLVGHARFLVYRAKLTGDLPDPKSLLCADCGAPARVYDHRDYAKPLDVIAVCNSCNLMRGPALQLRPGARVEAAHG